MFNETETINDVFKLTKSLIRYEDSHSSGSMTDKEINHSPEGAEKHPLFLSGLSDENASATLILQRFKPAETAPPVVQQPDAKIMSKYKNYMISASALEAEKANSSLNHIDALLEKEKKTFNNEPWNKLDKRLKIQKLHAYAEKYGRENAFSTKDVKGLKLFFSECLMKDKMAKVRDVEYDKAIGIISAIPGLFFNPSTRVFTLRNLDKKVSTLKSLTPKKVESSD